jgi:hypothetical protein
MQSSLPGNRAWCLGHLDSFGHCHHTQCGLVHKDGIHILAAEGLEAGPIAAISTFASLAATPPAMVVATSLEALKPLPLDASLRAAETVLIV